MNPETWEKVKRIVGAALERDPAGRSAYLEEACGWSVRPVRRTRRP